MSKRPPLQDFEIQRLDRAMVASLRRDVDTLLKAFLESEEHSLATLGKLMKGCDFPTIFVGRLSFAELVEFSEALLTYIAHFMFDDFEGNIAGESQQSFIVGGGPTTSSMTQTSSQQTAGKAEKTLQERLFGIYATYLTYFLQPNPFVFPIRVSIRQMASLRPFMADVLLPSEHFEALYCVHRLIEVDAFTLMPFEREFNPLLYRRYDVTDAEGLGNEDLEAIEDFAHLKALRDDTLTAQLNLVHRQYMEAKASFSGATPLPKSVHQLKDEQNPATLIDELIAESQRRLEQALAEKESAAEKQKEKSVEPTHSTRRNQIIQRAYHGSVKHRRMSLIRLQQEDEQQGWVDISVDRAMREGGPSPAKKAKWASPKKAAAKKKDALAKRKSAERGRSRHKDFVGKEENAAAAEDGDTSMESELLRAMEKELGKSKSEDKKRRRLLTDEFLDSSFEVEPKEESADFLVDDHGEPVLGKRGNPLTSESEFTGEGEKTGIVGGKELELSDFLDFEGPSTSHLINQMEAEEAGAEQTIADLIRGLDWDSKKKGKGESGGRK